jgi:hypothetical protein
LLPFTRGYHSINAPAFPFVFLKRLARFAFPATGIFSAELLRLRA